MSSSSQEPGASHTGSQNAAPGEPGSRPAAQHATREMTLCTTSQGSACCQGRPRPRSCRRRDARPVARPSQPRPPAKVASWTCTSSGSLQAQEAWPRHRLRPSAQWSRAHSLQPSSVPQARACREAVKVPSLHADGTPRSALPSCQTRSSEHRPGTHFASVCIQT